MKIFYCLLICWIFLSPIAIPQSEDVAFQTISFEQGLSHNAVYSITQDKEGLIWIGTQDGLNRFDGYYMTDFLYDPAKPNSLSSNNISYILNDNKNRLWIGTFGGGLCTYDFENSTFASYHDDDNKLPTLAGNRIQYIFEDKTNILWLGTAGAGVRTFDPEKKNFTKILNDPNQSNSLPHNRIWSICEDGDERIWIGTTGGISVYNKYQKTFTTLLPNEPPHLAERARLTRAVMYASDGTIWAGTEYGIYIYDRNLNVIEHKLLDKNVFSAYKNNIINVFYELQDHRILVGTAGGGLFIFDTDRKTFKQYTNDPRNPQSITGNDVRSIFVDKGGLVWLGTRGGGISTTYLKDLSFLSINDNASEVIHISGKYVRSVVFDEDENCFAGTYENGLNKVSANLKSVTQVRHIDASKPDLGYRFYSMFRDSAGTIWCATDDGLHYIPKGSDRLYEFIPYTENTVKLRKDKIWCMYVKPGKKIFIGMNGAGLAVYDIKNKKWSRYTSQEGIGSDEIGYIMEDRDGFLWLASVNGLTKFNPNTGKSTVYGTDAKSNFVMKNVFTWAILQTNDEYLWIATSAGLKSFNTKTGVFKTFNKTIGFASDIINGLVEDRTGNFWLSTNRGITKFNRKTNELINFDKGDGLDPNLYSPGSFALSPKGKIAFGGVYGLTVFDPEKVIRNNYVPPVIITKFIVRKDGELVNLIHPGTGDYTTRIMNLTSDQNYIVLGFASLNYHNSNKNNFKYKLEGIDADWHEASATREVTYSSLEPGTYEFKVIASNDDNVWNTIGTSVKFVISPPWYSTWFFRIFTFLAIIVAGFSFVWARDRNSRQMREKLELQVEQRTHELKKSESLLIEANSAKDKFFSIISHDLRSPFNALIGFSSILKEDFSILTDDEKLRFIEKLESTSRSTYNLLENLLLWSRAQSKRIVVSPIKFKLGQMIETQTIIFTQTTSLKHIKLNVEIDTEIEVFADIDMIVTVLRNIVLNAVKFTNEDGIITISSEMRDDNVLISVSDTGIGISATALEKIFSGSEVERQQGTKGEKGSGLGLILCKEFVEMNKGTISVSSKLGEGSTFTFSLRTKPW